VRWLLALLAGCSFRAGATGESSSADGPGSPRDGQQQLDSHVSDGTAPLPDGPPPPITLVQKKSSSQGGGDAISATFGAQSDQDLNVVVVKWDSGSTPCTGVTDASGNAYAKVGTTVTDGSQSMDVWYATDIVAAASNKVTATFMASVTTSELRMLEYSGMALVSPVDGSSTGSSATSSTALDSGTVITANPRDVLILAEASTQAEQSVSSGFHVELSVNSDVVADQIVSTAGSYDGTAVINPAGHWMIMLVAFEGQ